MIYTLGEYGLRHIEEKDLELLLKWRNSEQIHKQMLTDHIITWEEHCAWFRQIKEELLKRNFIFCFNNTPIGYVGYTEYDIENQTCSPGAYLGPNMEVPIDAGITLFYVSIEYAFSKLSMKKLNTEVFKHNKKAIKLDKFLGYEFISEHIVMKNGTEKIAIRAELTREHWESVRTNVLAMFNFNDKVEEK